MPHFILDERLERDSVSIQTLTLSDLRLAKDSRWPWLILVPQRVNVSEIFDLSPEDQMELAREQARIGAALKAMTGATKINVAAIGNMVRQLHVHVVARFEGDANWPGPIWGFGQAVPYEPQAFEALKAELQKAVL
ncbi:HIT family protein [Rhizobium paknamense]|uniref:Diadenosine tetraphosphate (Ap4A) HIT family hydrolase n=1 Tax=Rhizobium paknamense TaxID=1206817 RepID=A0ABU0IJF9_9HYPH|nr:HIT family protein [Rhizobium paknamense]MDQ0458388.1 diadenosine tetraphosphate (Ap4A) HIT family hydrolase [Rhizobium paknamense]